MAKTRHARRRLSQSVQKKAQGVSGTTVNGSTTSPAQKEHENAPSKEASPSHARQEVVSEENHCLDLDADVVFQCVSCQSIIGDTQSEYHAHIEFQILSLKAASNVSIKEELHVSKSGFDAGCLYKIVVCSQCQNPIGRTYTSTTKELDSLRSSYTFTHTGLRSYQLGSSKTMDGQYEPNSERRANLAQTVDARPEKRIVLPDAFDALDSHVGNLTDATNKLTEAFNQNRDSICDMKQALDSTSESLTELRGDVEHVQNLMLLWEERFQRLEACEQGLEKINADCHRYDLCERRVNQMEDAIRNHNAVSGRARRGRSQTPSMHVIPTIQKTRTSPARSSLQRRRQ